MVPSRSLSARLAAAVAAAPALLLVLACSGRVGPAPQPPQQPQQEQPPPRVEPPTQRPPKLDEPAVSLPDVMQLFDLGKEGEAKYKGKVVAVRGKVDFALTTRARAPSLSTVALQGGEGEPRYAYAFVDEASSELLFSGKWGPHAWVSLEGVYYERHARGTIALSPARVTAVTALPPTYRPRPKKAAPPTIVPAEKLARDLSDNLKGYSAYQSNPLQIHGVIHRRTENKGAIIAIYFRLPIEEPKTGEPIEFDVFCGLKTPVPLGGEAAAELAAGKKVTLRGYLSAGSNRHAALSFCVIVRE